MQPNPVLGYRGGHIALPGSVKNVPHTHHAAVKDELITEFITPSSQAVILLSEKYSTIRAWCPETCRTHIIHHSTISFFHKLLYNSPAVRNKAIV